MPERLLGTATAGAKRAGCAWAAGTCPSVCPSIHPPSPLLMLSAGAKASCSEVPNHALLIPTVKALDFIFRLFCEMDFSPTVLSGGLRPGEAGLAAGRTALGGQDSPPSPRTTPRPFRSHIQEAKVPLFPYPKALH